MGLGATFRGRRLPGSAAAILLAVLPLSLMLALPAVIQWRAIFPEIYPAGQGDGAAGAGVLANLSLSLISVALAIIVGVAVLLRSPSQRLPPLTLWSMVFVILFSCVLSIYAGYSFQIAIADQITSYHLEIPLLVDRLEWQATACAAAGSFLFALLVVSLTPSPPPREAAARASPKPRQPSRRKPRQ